MMSVLSSVQVQFNSISPRAVISLLQLSVASRLGVLGRRDCMCISCRAWVMESKQLQVDGLLWLNATSVALRDWASDGSGVMPVKSPDRSSDILNRGSSLSELGR